MPAWSPLGKKLAVFHIDEMMLCSWRVVINPCSRRASGEVNLVWPLSRRIPLLIPHLRCQSHQFIQLGASVVAVGPLLQFRERPDPVKTRPFCINLTIQPSILLPVTTAGPPAVTGTSDSRPDKLKRTAQGAVAWCIGLMTMPLVALPLFGSGKKAGLPPTSPP